MPYIKEVLIDVITDVNASESSTTTDHALEDSEQVTDHVKADPITITLKGVILDNTEEKILKLREYREKGIVINYDYMTELKHVVITNFGRDYAANIKNGFAFSLTLKQIQTAKVAKYVPVKLKKQTKPVTSKGRQQSKKTQKSNSNDTRKKYTNTRTPQRRVVSNGWELTE